MPFANLPDTHQSRWGDELTAEKMKECVWLRPEAVAQIEFLEWTEGDRLRHSKFTGLREDTRTLVAPLKRTRLELSRTFSVGCSEVAVLTDDIDLYPNQMVYD